MIYRKFQGLQLPALGLGCMRFPTLNNDNSHIDETETARLVQYAMEHGVNYFDTAWMYHGGNSEAVMGKILSKYPRESFFLASKFPGFNSENMQDISGTFETQLKRCQTDYFDFYLFHSVTDKNVDLYLDRNTGLFDYLVTQKHLGRIRHLGFSCHGSVKTMERFLTCYGNEIEFCQIQLNYLDWKMQNAKEKTELLNRWNVPIWVMEPVRGGKLANLPDEDVKQLNTLRSGVKVPEWAFRFLQSIDGVTMVLSGMSNIEQLQENIHSFQELKPLNKKEFQVLLEIADRIIRKNAIPCTGCCYCTEQCPQHLPIPALIQLYNARVEGRHLPILTPGPNDCIACHSCEKVCPQGIDIADVMESFSEIL